MAIWDKLVRGGVLCTDGVYERLEIYDMHGHVDFASEEYVYDSHLRSRKDDQTIIEVKIHTNKHK
jgi:hypothetical protein